MYLWILWTFSSLIIFRTILQVFEPKHSLKVVILIFFTGTMLYSILKEWCYLYHQLDFPSLGLLLLAFQLAVIIWGFHGGWLKKVVLMFSYVVISGGIEGFLIFILGCFMGKTGKWYLEQSTFLIMFFIDHLFLVLCLNIIEAIWKRNKMDKEWDGGWCFFIMMLAQAATFLPGAVHIVYANENRLYGVAGLAMSFLLIFFLLILVSETIKREKIEKELERLKRLYDLDNLNLILLGLKKEEILKMCHDFNNQLTVVYSIGKLGKSEDAKELLLELEERIDKNRMR